MAARALHRHLLETCLRCIVQHGIAGTSFRVVADMAQSSTGIIAYHYGNKDGLLYAAFTLFVEDSINGFEDFYRGAATLEQARSATTGMFTATANSRASVALGAELYSLALRRPRYRLLLQHWTRSCRAVMGRHFDPLTTLLLDALYEGVILHRNMELGEYPDSAIAAAVERLTPPGTWIGPPPPPVDDHD